MPENPPINPNAIDRQFQELQSARKRFLEKIASGQSLETENAQLSAALTIHEEELRFTWQTYTIDSRSKVVRWNAGSTDSPEHELAYEFIFDVVERTDREIEIARFYLNAEGYVVSSLGGEKAQRFQVAGMYFYANLVRYVFDKLMRSALLKKSPNPDASS